MYRPSGEKLRKLSSSSGLTPRPGTGGRVVSTRSPEGVVRCQALPSRYVTDRPSGLNANWRAPDAPLPTTCVVPPLPRSTLMSWLLPVWYATCVPVTNCGFAAPASNWHRFLAFAGSWMSRTTMGGSPATGPMTRLSPAGTAVVQRTRAVPPGVPLGLADGVEEEAGDELAVTGGWAVGLGDPVPLDGPPPHAASASRATAATRVTSTR